MSRFFINDSNIHDEAIIMTDTEEINHITKVLRLKPGACITLSDGKGMDYDCTINEIAKDNVTLKIDKAYKNINEAPIKITIFQGIPKSDKMDFIVQKCTELGVSEIGPVSTKFIVSKIENEKDAIKKTNRWQKIAKEASKQCNRGIVPQILKPVNFKAALELSKNFDLALIAYEKSEPGTLNKVLNEYQDIKSVCVFIGPEGGFDEAEVELALTYGVKVISLGKRILRTETAPLAIMSILIYNYDVL
jgi:16S rRNA (uracil1498-N3)-methyltransferase